MDPWLDWRRRLRGESVGWHQPRSIRCLGGVIAAELHHCCMCLLARVQRWHLVIIINCVCVCVGGWVQGWEGVGGGGGCREQRCFTQVHRLMSRADYVYAEVNMQKHPTVLIFLPSPPHPAPLPRGPPTPSARGVSQPRIHQELRLRSLTSPPSHPDETSGSLTLEYSLSNNTYACARQICRYSPAAAPTPCKSQQHFISGEWCKQPSTGCTEPFFCNYCHRLPVGFRTGSTHRGFSSFIRRDLLHCRCQQNYCLCFWIPERVFPPSRRHLFAFLREWDEKIDATPSWLRQLCIKT